MMSFVSKNFKPIILLVILFSSVLGYAALTSLKYDGNISELFQSNSNHFTALAEMEKNFHKFSSDEIFLLTADNFSNDKIFLAVYDFITELQLLDNANAIVSIFTIPDKDNPTSRFLSRKNIEKAGIHAILQTLRETVPLSQGLLSQDFVHMLIIIEPASDNNKLVEFQRDELLSEIDDIHQEYSYFFSIQPVGLQEIQQQFESYLRIDQIKLAGLSILFCSLLGIWIFGSWQLALVSGIPVVNCIIWYFGLIALLQTPINLFTAIVPIVMIVLAFADSIHIIYSFKREFHNTKNLQVAVKRAIQQIGPLCFLTSLTTAIAFAIVGASSYETMWSLAWAGILGMVLSFSAVIFLLPCFLLFVLTYFPLQVKPGKDISKPIRNIIHFPLHWPKTTVCISLFLTLLFSFAHFQLQISFSLNEYLTADSSLSKAHKIIDDNLLGSQSIYVVVDDADQEVGISSQDIDRLENVATILWNFEDIETAATGQSFSNNTINSASFEDETFQKKRFISEDGLQYLLFLPISALTSSPEIVELVEKLERRFDQSGVNDFTKIAGTALVTGYDIPEIISELRYGFLFAVIFILATISIAMKSIKLGLSALIPNLLPIFIIETWLYLSDQPLGLSTVIALIVAFSICVDDSIHMIGRYRFCMDTDPQTGLVTAINDVKSPLITTTLILTLGLSVCLLSNITSIIWFGKIVIAALILALLADLLILPSIIKLLHRSKTI